MACRMRVAPASMGTSSRAGRRATSAYASVARRRARAGPGGPARERSTPLPGIARRQRTTTAMECRTTPSMPCVFAEPRRRGRAASMPARTARGVARPEPRPASSRLIARPAPGARARVASGRRPPTPARRATTTTATAAPTRAAPASKAVLSLAALSPRSESARRARRLARTPPGAPASGRYFLRRATAPRRWTMTATGTPTTRSTLSVPVRPLRCRPAASTLVRTATALARPGRRPASWRRTRSPVPGARASARWDPRPPTDATR